MTDEKQYREISDKHLDHIVIDHWELPRMKSMEQQQLTDEELDQILIDQSRWLQGNQQEPRQLTDEELDQILTDHWRWLESNQERGTQADLRNCVLNGARLKHSWHRLQKDAVVTTEQIGIFMHAYFLPDLISRPTGSYGDPITGVILIYAHLEGAHLIEAHLEGAILIEAHLEGAHLSKAHLEGAILPEAHLEGAYLGEAHLERAILSGAHLELAQLRFAHLEGAILREAHLKRAYLWNARLEEAYLMNARLEEAYLGEAHLEGAILGEAHLEGAYLGGAHLEGASLRGAHLAGAVLLDANLSGVNLSRADIKGAYLSGIIYDKTEKYAGIRVVECFGGEGFVRFANDQAWLEDFKSTRITPWQNFWAGFWKISSDYGRSIEIWALWSFIIAVFFAYMFTPLPDFIANLMPDRMQWLIDLRPALTDGGKPVGFYSALYFSIVTFTTLGFGDIVAANTTARILVTLEVIVGYIMLGGLISIFANKFARRS